MAATRPTEVFYELLDPDSVAVADAIFSFHGAINTLTDSIRAVRPWTPETTPDLYPSPHRERKSQRAPD